MVITTLTPNMSVRNHINEICELFLDGNGKKEREKSIQEHSEKIIQFLHADPNDDISEDDIITDDEDIEELRGDTFQYHGGFRSRRLDQVFEEVNLEYYFEYYGFLTAPADMDRTDARFGAIPPMPDDVEPEMICLHCRQETHCREVLCINCSRLLFDRVARVRAQFQISQQNYSEYLDRTNGAITTDDGITDDDMPEEEPGMICSRCRQETHSTSDVCINCLDGITEPDSTTSNAPDPAATSAPADVERLGTGVGAIVSEEPNRCVDFCVCSNCNELEIDSESEINNDSGIEYERPPQQNGSTFRIEHILNMHAPNEERPLPHEELAFTVPHVINGRAYTRNLPRPSPYTLEGRPRKSSNRRDPGR